MKYRNQSGFTIIELITVIVLIGALAAVASIFIVQPFQAVEDMRRRAELVDEAQLIIERMAREIRTALPNSVRVDSSGSLTGIELVSTRTGGRYRRLLAPGGGGGDRLNRTQSSDTFDVLGGLIDAAAVDTSGSAGTNCVSGNGDCISIYNTGQTNFDVYAGDNIAKVVSAGANSLGYDNGGATPAFRQHSPQQRFFVIDDVVSFVCDTGSDRMNRHSRYGLNGTQDLTPGGTTALMARDVTGCSFTYDQGSSSRAGLVTLNITISRDGETVQLLQQVHVMNAP
ncbi:MAG: type II secretion system protein [Halofilum sp. (in: g-proteobacteria)]|nr:type II secretion system protein [Halofilum sp. (in: g-proteobacteria)]